MVAPPVREGTDIFVHIARAWKAHGLQVPTVEAWDPAQGFVLLSDFGDTLLLEVLTPETADHFYTLAMHNIAVLQSFKETLPRFDEAHIRQELGVFREWFVEKLLGHALTPSDEALLAQWNQQLIDNITTQPQVAIHLDYHARNLMVLKEGLGIIDFQDAKIGPITYDAVSLLKDAYIHWPREKVCDWVEQFRVLLNEKYAYGFDPVQFLQWFDWMGVQRHLKILGVFSRLNLRDQKTRYMQDVPRVLGYVLEITKHYPAFVQYDAWLRALVAKYSAEHVCVQ